MLHAVHVSSEEFTIGLTCSKVEAQLAYSEQNIEYELDDVCSLTIEDLCIPLVNDAIFDTTFREPCGHHEAGRPRTHNLKRSY